MKRIKQWRLRSKIDILWCVVKSIWDISSKDKSRDRAFSSLSSTKTRLMALNSNLFWLKMDFWWNQSNGHCSCISMAWLRMVSSNLCKQLRMSNSTTFGIWSQLITEARSLFSVSKCQKERRSLALFHPQVESVWWLRRVTKTATSSKARQPGR